MEVALNLLVLPLLGGYVFYKKWNVTAYHAVRCTGQRLFFHAAVFGLVLLLLARFLVICNEAIVEAGLVSQSTPANWALYLVLGGIITLWISLFWIYLNSRMDSELRNELGLQKPAIGFCLAIITAAVFGRLLFQAPDDWLVVILRVITCASAFIFLAIGFTHLLSWGIEEEFEENIGFQFRPSSLVFRASVLLLIVAEIVLVWTTTANEVDVRWSRFSPYADSGTAFLACVLGAFSWIPLNLMVPYQVAIAWLHQNQKTSSLERLFYRAAITKTLVQISLIDGKFYVGWVHSLPPNPASMDAHLEFQPSMSGYRDPTTKVAILTEFYDELHSDLDFNSDDLVKVIPLNNIDSAGKFKVDVYERSLERYSQAADSPNGPPEAESAETLPLTT